MNRHDRLYRDTEQGWIAGVCAGIADYAGTDPALVRVFAVIGLVFFFVPVLIAYVVCADRAEAAAAGAVRLARGGALLARRAHRAGRGAARAERPASRAEPAARPDGDLVTSDEFDLRRGFRDLGA